MEFSKEVVDKLGYYVYRLVDPRNGETFYVGKGKGNRVFDHVAETLKLMQKDKKEDEEENEEDALSLKQETIRAIKQEGLDVITIIHRHGMDEPTAFEVESALIDAYPGLSNAIGGHGSDYGAVNAAQIISRYSAEVADFSKYVNSLIIKITQNSLDLNYGNIYETVRADWKLKSMLLKKNTIPYVFASLNGIIKGVYKVDRWLPSQKVDGRIIFEGTEAKELKDFIGKAIPDSYCEKGAANPTMYIR